MLIRALLFFVGRWICQYFFTLIPNSLKILPWLKWTPSLSPTHFLKLKKLKGSVYNWLLCSSQSKKELTVLLFCTILYTKTYLVSHSRTFEEHSNAPKLPTTKRRDNWEQFHARQIASKDFHANSFAQRMSYCVFYFLRKTTGAKILLQ